MLNHLLLDGVCICALIVLKVHKGFSMMDLDKTELGTIQLFVCCVVFALVPK